MDTSSKPARLGVIVGATRYVGPTTGELRFCFDLLDLDAGRPEPDRIPLDFLAHGFAVHPRRRREAALLEKQGPGGCYVDLVDRTVLRSIEPLPGHHFYGHGAFSRDGEVLFAIETELASKAGVISVRDPERFQVIETFPTYGAAPHDCVLIEQGKTLAITNGGGPFGGDEMPCVTFVDVASRKLLEKHVVSNPRINTGHIALGRGRDFAVVSAPRHGLPETDLGGVSLRTKGRPLQQVTRPEAVTRQMIGESLSICVHEQAGIALATHPAGNFISFWKLDSGALFATFDLPHPRGVTLTLDRRCFVVSFGVAASLLLIETQPLRPVTERPRGARHFSGSHIYTWSPT